MHVKSLLAATVLLLIPTLGVAAGCSHGASDSQAMSCVVGTQWDAETGTCVPLTTS